MLLNLAYRWNSPYHLYFGQFPIPVPMVYQEVQVRSQVINAVRTNFMHSVMHKISKSATSTHITQPQPHPHFENMSGYAVDPLGMPMAQNVTPLEKIAGDPWPLM